MNITIIGTGYVGLVTGTCFSDMGNEVYCVDVLEEKIQSLKKGIVPIYEPGLEELIKRNYERGNLHFTTNLKEGLDNSELCFIAVGTPMGEDGSADLQYVRQVAKQIGQTIIRDIIVVDKSTVPVGTADEVKAIIQEELDNRGKDYKVCVVSNPEFLKEGNAVNDFMHPDRIIVGTDSDYASDIMAMLYEPFTKNHERMIIMDIKSAEMTKYASNCMLANRISFMNEMANICDKLGANIDNVRKGMGSDSRIGSSFLYAGCGYGGSCFPKDVIAMIKTATDAGYDPVLLKSVEEVNNNQKQYLSNKIKSVLGNDLTGVTFAIWGLSFKPETDDMREAPSITIIKELLDAGAKINAYDPKSMDIAKEFYFKDLDINYCNNKYEAIEGADVLVIVTEWKEFRSPDFKNFWGTPWSKFVRRDFLLNNEIFFPNLVPCEDHIWTFGLFFFAKRFLRVPNAIYIRRMSKGSEVRAKRTREQKFLYWLNASILGSKFLDQMLGKIEFFQKNIQCRYAMLEKLSTHMFELSFKSSLQIPQHSLYAAIKNKFGNELGDYDVLIPLLCSIINKYQKVIEEKNALIAKLKMN